MTGPEWVDGLPQPVDVVLVEHDPRWAARYAEHEARLRAALGARALRVEHVGSTAVPGLVAKPVLDLCLVVEDPADEPAWLPALEAAGYVLRLREPADDEHRLLRTPEKDLQLHVYPPWSGALERYLLLRDLLRADPVARADYAAVKQSLAGRTWPTMDHYAEAKSEVVQALLAQARAR